MYMRWEEVRRIVYNRYLLTEMKKLNYSQGLLVFHTNSASILS